MANRPRLFIGSATESKHVAEALQAVLDAGLVEVTLWPDIFKVGEYTYEDLEDAAKSHDFAAFVFSPDDELTSRGVARAAPRDNVVYELGLFSGVQGRRHVFVVQAHGANVKIPTDLSGITFASYQPPDADENAHWDSALRPAARKISEAIRQRTAEAISSGQARTESAEQPPLELLGGDLLSAARAGLLESLPSRVSVGILVVHPVHGVGQVVGFDPLVLPDPVLRVRFESGIGLMPRSEFFSPKTTA